MLTMRDFARACAGAGLVLATLPALADGSGAMSDAAMTFEYTSGTFVAPNMTPFAGDPVPVVCEPGTPTCDIYTLTIDFSEEFRTTNLDAFVDISMEWGGTPTDVGGVITVPDFDMYLYDAAGNNLSGTSAVTAANPEIISMPLELLPNGTYEVRVIPFFPMGEAFTLKGGLSSLASTTKTGVLGVGAIPALLIPLFAAAAWRRRRPTAKE